MNNTRIEVLVKGRRFEMVTADEWAGLSTIKHSHVDCVQAMDYLRKSEVGDAIKLQCSIAMIFRKLEASHRLAQHRKIKIETKWRDGWFYARRIA